MKPFGALPLQSLTPRFQAIQPSLLHGNLLSDNLGCDNEGYPTLSNPSCYYGHHEADMAWLHFIGGVGAR